MQIARPAKKSAVAPRAHTLTHTHAHRHRLTQLQFTNPEFALCFCYQLLSLIPTLLGHVRARRAKHAVVNQPGGGWARNNTLAKRMLYQLRSRGAGWSGAIRLRERPWPRRSIERTQRCQGGRHHTHARAERQHAQECISREPNPGHIDGNDVFYH